MYIYIYIYRKRERERGREREGERERERNPLNNYLPVQEDLFFDTKVSYSKVNKV